MLLPCGGYLVIDETEALIAIDVNTGRNKGTKDLDKTILDTNLEAAYEIARQLRLRNIGGLVVVDFIDMRHRKDQQAVYKAMKDRLKRDKGKNPGTADHAHRPDGNDAPAAQRKSPGIRS